MMRLFYRCNRKAIETLFMSIIVLFIVLLPIAHANDSNNRLHFRTTAEFSPTEAMPDTNPDHDEEATWRGGIWTLASMTLDDGTTSSETQTMTLPSGEGTGYYRGVSFISEPISGPASLPAANWTVHIHGYRTPQTAGTPRAYIYEWTNPGDVKGDVISSSPVNGPDFMQATDTAMEWNVPGSAVTIENNYKVVVDVYYNVTTYKSGKSFYLIWGKEKPASDSGTSDDGWLLAPGSLISTLGWFLLALAVGIFVFFAYRKGDLKLKTAAVSVMVAFVFVLPSLQITNTIKPAYPDVYLTVKGRKIPLYVFVRPADKEIATPLPSQKGEEMRGARNDN